MRCSLLYTSGKQFGNSDDAPRYTMTLSQGEANRHIPVVTLEFSLKTPAAARGIGELQGQIEKVSISLSQHAADLLARSLIFASREMPGATITYDVNEDQSPTQNDVREPGEQEPLARTNPEM